MENSSFVSGIAAHTRSNHALTTAIKVCFLLVVYWWRIVISGTEAFVRFCMPIVAVLIGWFGGALQDTYIVNQFRRLIQCCSGFLLSRLQAIRTLFISTQLHSFLDFSAFLTRHFMSMWGGWRVFLTSMGGAGLRIGSFFKLMLIATCALAPVAKIVRDLCNMWWSVVVTVIESISRIAMDLLHISGLQQLIMHVCNTLCQNFFSLCTSATETAMRMLSDVCPEMALNLRQIANLYYQTFKLMAADPESLARYQWASDNASFLLGYFKADTPGILPPHVDPPKSDPTDWVF